MSMSLVDRRAETVLAGVFADTAVDGEDRAEVRVRVWEMSRSWAARHRRTEQRRQFNERLVLSMLGVADAEEEADVLWRLWCRPQQGSYR